MTFESDARARFLRHVGQTSPFPGGFEVSRAEGCYLYGPSGRRCLDFIAGIAVNNVGHCHPRIVRAVQAQAALYAHTMVYGEHVQAPQVELAAEIAREAPEGMDAVYFLTTGAEANDAALKMAAKLTGRSKAIAFRGAYHGDTVGALACFGDDNYRRPFRGLLHEASFLPFGDAQALESIGDTIAAVLVEPVQGEAGIRVPPDGFLLALRKRCTESGALLIFDEVQTGFGRIGDWFASRVFGVTPDAITIAKGMGAGYPLAGLVASRDMLYRFAADPPFSHITTFGGHPVSCAASLEGMRIMRDEGLLDNARARGEQLRSELARMKTNCPLIRDVRGIGLMIGVELANESVARQVVNDCLEAGLIIESTLLAGETIRFSPPLIVTSEQCEEALGIFASVVNRIPAGLGSE